MTGEPAFRIEKISDGIHFARALDGGDALCNSVILDLGEATVVFDAMLTPRAGEELRRAAESLTGRPTAWVVNSHYHGDHVRGNASLRPATVVSSQRTRELMQQRGEEQLDGDRKQAPLDLVELAAGRYPCAPSELRLLTGWFQGLVDTPDPFPWALPQVTFQHRLELHGSSRSVELLTFGGGHSPSDVLLHSPSDHLVVLGDLLSVGFHPWLTDGDPREFERILGEVERLRPERAAPGHGEMGGAASIARTREYLQEMLGSAAKAIASGQSAKEFAARPMPPDASAWKFSNMFVDNSTFVYDRLRATPAR